MTLVWPPRPNRSCWQTADEHIIELKASLARTIDTVHKALIVDEINRWLDYRFSHGPDDLETP